jgi:hypothetical protein
VPCLECIKHGSWGKQYFDRSKGNDGKCLTHLGVIKFPDREFSPNDREILELTNMILREYLNS